LFCLELLLLALLLNLDEWLAIIAFHDLVTPVFHVLLDEWVVELLSNHSLSILDGVKRVLGNLVLGCITDEALLVCECDIRRGCLVTLVVRYDFNVIVAEDCNT